MEVYRVRPIQAPATAITRKTNRLLSSYFSFSACLVETTDMRIPIQDALGSSTTSPYSRDVSFTLHSEETGEYEVIVRATVYINVEIEQAYVEYRFRRGQFRLGLTGVLLADGRATYNQAILAGASLAPLSNIIIFQLHESLDPQSQEDILKHAWQLGVHLIIRTNDDAVDSNP